MPMARSVHPTRPYVKEGVTRHLLALFRAMELSHEEPENDALGEHFPFMNAKLCNVPGSAHWIPSNNGVFNQDLQESTLVIAHWNPPPGTLDPIVWTLHFGVAQIARVELPLLTQACCHPFLKDNVTPELVLDLLIFSLTESDNVEVGVYEVQWYDGAYLNHPDSTLAPGDYLFDARTTRSANRKLYSTPIQQGMQ